MGLTSKIVNDLKNEQAHNVKKELLYCLTNLINMCSYEQLEYIISK